MFELQAFLEAPLSESLPLADPRLTALQLSPQHARVAALLEDASVSGAVALSDILVSVLKWPFVQGESEQHTLLAVETLFITPLFELDSLAPPQAQLLLVKQRDSSDTSTGRTAPITNGKAMRPALQLRSSDGRRLLFKGEDKGKSLDAARADLVDKMPPSCSLLDVNLPYLLCYAAAGESFQLFAIAQNNTRVAVPVSRVYNLQRADHRVLLLCLAVQTHRVLQMIARALPTHLLSVVVDDVNDNGE